VIERARVVDVKAAGEVELPDGEVQSRITNRSFTAIVLRKFFKGTDYE
jgi:hypothetical protein